MSKYAVSAPESLSYKLEPLGFKWSYQTKRWVITDPSDEALKAVEKYFPERLYHPVETDLKSHEGTLWIDADFNNGHREVLNLLGCRWSKKYGRWYLQKATKEKVAMLKNHGLTSENPSKYPAARTLKAITELANIQSAIGFGARVMLNVPYHERDYAKACGARWDAEQKGWYVYRTNPYHQNLVERFGVRQAATA
jgi:hypothetical protein